MWTSMIHNSHKRTSQETDLTSIYRLIFTYYLYLIAYNTLLAKISFRLAVTSRLPALMIMYNTDDDMSIHHLLTFRSECTSQKNFQRKRRADDDGKPRHTFTTNYTANKAIAQAAISAEDPNPAFLQIE